MSSEGKTSQLDSSTLQVTQEIRARPNSVEYYGGKKQKYSLFTPPSLTEYRLSEQDGSFIQLELKGDDVLNFVKHYSDPSAGRFYFRGEALFSTMLLPSLFRSNNLELLLKAWGKPKDPLKDPLLLQDKILNRFKRYTWHIFHAESDLKGQNLSKIANLCIAQHNGLPTTLLDWSLNPFIALFFAARYPTRSIGHEKHLNPATIWVMRLKETTAREKLTLHLEDEKNPDDFIKDNQENPIVVVPLSFTRRIDAQSGRFIDSRCLVKDLVTKGGKKWVDIPSLHTWPTTHAPWIKIDQWIIPAEERVKVLDQLRILGFHDGKMFPDLKGWANFLQAGHK